MGDAMGIAKPKEDENDTDGMKPIEIKGSSNHTSNQNNDISKNTDNDTDLINEEDIDYKEGSSFAKHMKNIKHDPQSQFAKTKTIKEQREYLPVYAVRDELLSVVRENQITVIVGETGSG